MRFGRVNAEKPLGKVSPDFEQGTVAIRPLSKHFSGQLGLYLGPTLVKRIARIFEGYEAGSTRRHVLTSGQRRYCIKKRVGQENCSRFQFFKRARVYNLQFHFQ
ncbi:uncharacterized protein LOC126602198 isoform X2 [Malus sylvestris]|uniref:uncharacterized protein LOC126602198 isoform X2 n=1 Tax=Malus sylvestris TaxID=3752 RepID=UPI0021AD4579|nr:uncharacterized protein LOC126602198 isoform X2 [Malus sylvestris]